MASEKLSVRQKHKNSVGTHLSELEITTGRETPPTLDSLRNYVQQQENRETYRRYRIPFEGEEETSSQEACNEERSQWDRMEGMIKTMAELAFAGRSREPNVSEYYQRQEKIEAEKCAIQSLQKFEQGMNLAAFIAEFEVAMRGANINKDKWSHILQGQLKGQAWHDWVNHKGAGDALAYDSCKEIVLEMHGNSLLTCIKNVFNPKIKGESFGARSTLARAYMDRLFKGAHTTAQWQERVEMWIILSSYHEDCIAAVLNTNPLTKAQLASAVSQYMELHPEAGKRQSMQGNKFQGFKPYKNYYTYPSQDRSRGWQLQATAAMAAPPPAAMEA